MLQTVKIALRLRTTAFDVEINGLIAACKADLRLAGIQVPETDAPADGNELAAGDALIERAIILYCKANFGYLENSERYLKAYDLLKCSLSLAGDYIAVE